MTIGRFAHLGGLKACPYWASHHDSPGEPLDPLAETVIDLWQTVQILGWDGAMATAPHAQCSPYEASLVTEGIQWLMLSERKKDIRKAELARDNDVRTHRAKKQRRR